MSETTSDTTVTGVSGLTYDRGLGYDRFPGENVLFSYDRSGAVVGPYCNRFNALPNEIFELDPPALEKELERQFQVLHAGLVAARYTSTSCLLKAAVAFHQLLLLFTSRRNDGKAIVVSRSLIDIFNEVEKRTRIPYQFQISVSDQTPFRPLPQKILTDFPLSEQMLWKAWARRKLPKQSNVGGHEDALIPLITKEEKPVDEEKLLRALNIAEANFKITRALDRIPWGDTPLVNRYVANLDKLTLEDVYNQTGVTIKNRVDWKLSELVEIVLYGSCITLVLNKDGEPFDGNGVYGLFRYGMILPSKKFKTIRLFPPPGQYVSLGPLAGQQFSFDAGIIKKLPVQYSGVLGFREQDVTGDWTPNYQVEANKIFSRRGAYIGSLVVPSAFRPNEITFSSLVSSLPLIAEETVPYFYRAVSGKLTEWFENPEALAQALGQEVLKQFVTQILIDVARSYLIKKIGAKVVPVINAVMAVKSAVDATTSDNVREVVAVNCVRLYLKGTTQDDRILSLKILGNVLSDEFEDRIKSAIVMKASSAGVKLAKRKNPLKKKPATIVPQGEAHKQLPETAPPDPKAGGKSPQEQMAALHNGIQKGLLLAKALEEHRATAHKGNIRPVETRIRPEHSAQLSKSPEDEQIERLSTRPVKKDKHEEDDDRKLISRRTEKASPSKKGRTNKESQTETDEEIDPGKHKGKKRQKPAPLILPTINMYQSAAGFRRDLLKLLSQNPRHPLIALYDAKSKKLNPSTEKGMDEFYWDEHPEAAQAGHVTSKYTGAPDKIVIMTASENQMLKSTIEGKKANASFDGNFKVVLIEGIPISLTSAQHMIRFGKLDPKVVEDAERDGLIINVNDL